ncbi:plasmid partitioning protein RepB [Methylobacterium haplocladii]|uniref:Plasmid partitioning protein RepB n=1 Tax=Methylobacterium haplocladii TaxID=1176176 RepID=A0A512ISB4_9HYPH|nr:plasmid partitioning protein RepB [Methylobacterium haplocladii]GEP00597.1 plasmid partitioning protein RepB [Methylobacterium haplocladii]GJD85512.1 Nucleoid occlusion protein [Methylobacterium haplocladii]GLS57745.1 plasmid partitioning protein RepB [Methylobacterium haplocladii]
MSRKANLSALLAGKTAPAPGPQTDAPAGNLAAAKITPAPTDKPDLAAAKKAPPDWSARPRSGAIRGMEATLRTLADGPGRPEDGTSVVELDPTLLDPSMVVDRVADPGDPSFAALVDSMRDGGQQVPILVRRHPQSTGRFQIAYGHRRWRAAAELGRPVRALIKPLTDDELVVAQGKENLERRDLSYIERALFAARMEAQGFKRETIWSAMGTVESEISRYVAIVANVPEHLIAAIGPAPKIGRPRWVAFSDRLRAVGAGLAEAAVAEPGFAEKATDDRFAAVFAALTAKPAAKAQRPQVWKDPRGRKVARVERSGGRFILSIDETLAPRLGPALFERLPEILAALEAGEDEPVPQREPKGDRPPE